MTPEQEEADLRRSLKRIETLKEWLGEYKKELEERLSILRGGVKNV